MSTLAIDPVFPDVIGQTKWVFRVPVKKTPSFKTLVQTTASSTVETRIALQQYPVWIFEMDLAYVIGDATPAQSASLYQTIVGFYGQVKGAAVDWLYFDPDDNGSSKTQVTASLTSADLQVYDLGVGDGLQNRFLLYRQLGGFNDLIQNFATGYPLIYKNGVLQAASTYNIDKYGMLTFNTPPAVSTVLQWAGQFYFRCRFMEDTWANLQSIKQRLWKNSSVKFKSLLR